MKGVVYFSYKCKQSFCDVIDYLSGCGNSLTLGYQVWLCQFLLFSYVLSQTGDNIGENMINIFEAASSPFDLVEHIHIMHIF